MTRIRYSWEELCTIETKEAAAEFVEGSFAALKSRTPTHYVNAYFAQGGEHLMVERRLKCTSKTCHTFGKCGAKFKTWRCDASDRTRIFQNTVDHVRDEAMACEGPHKSVVTAEMKKFILQQDECGISPQLILSNMRHVSDIVEPKRGYPTISQVTNCAKYLRKLKGTKNTVHAVKQMMREAAFDPTGDLNNAFFFGDREDDEGFTYVGKGTDDDSFVIGVTSIALVNAAIAYASGSRFTLFHADATFKLSDLGYPVITCGFSDSTRSYQLAAIFIVSRRTAKEYAMCLGAFSRVVKKVRPTATLCIDAVMGDAEDAQLNGFQQVAEFNSATYLMCFFHVLYNVRKRTRHLSPVHRKAVTEGIMRIHYTADMNAYYEEKEKVLDEWKMVPQLASFVAYFTNQWLESRYWRWQIFHTPSGYATTNNPCETFNALLKKYTGRRRFYMQRLLRISRVVVQDATKRTPALDNQIQQPAPFMARAASSMITLGKIIATATDNPSICRVKHVGAEGVSEDDDLQAVCNALDAPFQATPEPREDSDDQILGASLLLREQRTRAAQLYKSVVTWSLRYAHTSAMPEGGWVVDVDKCVCGCKFYSKHKTCCHVIVGRKAKKLGKPGAEDLTTKLFNRQVRKVKQGNPTLVSKRQKQHHEASSTPEVLSLTEPLEGRPPLASRALDVQFILCPDT